MGTKLQQVTEQIEARESYAQRREWNLGASLVQEIAAATWHVPGGRGLSKHERAALVQVVAEHVLTRHARRRGAACDVLAWIDRAERMPLIAAREDERATRREYGRTYLAAKIAEAMRDRRDWRDVAESHKMRERRDRERSGPMVTVESYERAEDAGILAQAAARATDPEVAPLPANVRDWAEAVAADLPDLSETEARRVLVALLVAGGVKASTVAAWPARSMVAVQMDSKRGAALLRERFPDPSDLIAYGRSVAAREGLLERGATDAPQLTGDELAALRAVESVSGWQPVRKASAAGLPEWWRGLDVPADAHMPPRWTVTRPPVLAP
jgi:hypothetical protein